MNFMGLFYIFIVPEMAIGRLLSISSIINLYGRKNVFSIYAGRGGEEYYKPMDIAQTYKIYLYGIVPSITYSFEF